MIRHQQGHGKGAGRRQARMAWALLLVLILLGLSSGTAHAQPVSAAETLLFETDHLARTRAPAALVYDFRKVSNVEPGFSDTVELDLSREDGHLHARLRFLSGERRREVPDIDDAHGNPVLLGFLEHDIAEMKRLTGGAVSYFRKRIRMALAHAAQPAREPFAFQGKTYEGQVVRIQPYLEDPLHARFEAYVHKTYTFVLSDAVPGGVYRISTSLGQPGRAIKASAGPGALAGGAARGQGEAAATKPGAQAPGAGDPPQIEETLTLVKVADPKG